MMKPVQSKLFAAFMLINLINARLQFGLWLAHRKADAGGVLSMLHMFSGTLFLVAGILVSISAYARRKSKPVV